MHPVTANASALGDRPDRIDGKRQRSAQESALLHWLQAKAPEAPPAATLPALAIRSRTSDGAPPAGNTKITTLRKALLAEGLDIIPDPLHRYPCTKVARAKGP